MRWPWANLSSLEGVVLSGMSLHTVCCLILMYIELSSLESSLSINVAGHPQRCRSISEMENYEEDRLSEQVGSWNREIQKSNELTL